MTPLPSDPTTHHRNSPHRCPSCTEPYCAEPSCLRPTCWDCGATLPDPALSDAFAALVELLALMPKHHGARLNVERSMGSMHEPVAYYIDANLNDPSPLASVTIHRAEAHPDHVFTRGMFRGVEVRGCAYKDAALPWIAAAERDARIASEATHAA